MTALLAKLFDFIYPAGADGVGRDWDPGPNLCGTRLLLAEF